MKTIVRDNDKITAAKATSNCPKMQMIPLPTSQQPRVNKVLSLQRKIGNWAVGRMIQAIQIKGTDVRNHASLHRIQSLCPECEKEAARSRLPNITSMGAEEMEPEEESRQILSALKRNVANEERPVFGIQKKLTVGSPEDEHELEAERVAERVAASSNSGNPDTLQQPFISRPKILGLLPFTTIAVEKISQNNVNAARRLRIAMTEHKSADPKKTVPATIEQRILQSTGKGNPLPARVRNIMSLHTGYDFSKVRVKTGQEAVELNKNLNARAFTYGSDIWLGENESVNDIRLMAHELTHVVQQGAAKKINNGNPSGPGAMKSTSKVVSFLQAFSKNADRDFSMYRNEITRFKKENSAEKIASLQRQILEPSTKGVDISQKSDSKTLRACGGGSGSAPPAATACACDVKSGPTYTPSGTIPVTTSGSRKSAPFSFASEFNNDTPAGKCPRCCEVRQFIKWDSAFHTWNGGPPHSGFPSGAAHSTWIEDRDSSDKRYGHRSGTHSDPIGGCGDEYRTGSSRDQANGNKYCGKDAPGGPSGLTGTWNFQLKVVDTCNSDAVKASSSIITVNW